MPNLNAVTSTQLKVFPDLDYKIKRSYKFRDLVTLKNSMGYRDLICRTEFPCLEATLYDFFFNDGCGREDLITFISDFKATRQAFLFLDEFNHKITNRQNLQIESYTTLEFIRDTQYYLYQNYRYGNVVVKKPVCYYSLTSLSINGVLTSFSSDIRSGVLDLGVLISSYTFTGTFYTPVKIKEGVETETVNNKLRTLGELKIYEYPIMIHDYPLGIVGVSEA